MICRRFRLGWSISHKYLRSQLLPETPDLPFPNLVVASDWGVKGRRPCSLLGRLTV